MGNERFTVHVGDNLPILKTLADNSVDAIVTDPPAGIGFMQRDWDSDKGGRDKWIEWMAGIAAECLRVIKPGGHALVWALPRTSHWTATAWENAGWEPRDRICHIFSTGFPKSANISKQIDRMAGAEREIVRFERHGKTALGVMNDDAWQAQELVPYTAPATDAAKQWDGWGTALKPAVEDYWLFRKPLAERTIAANVLEWGTGGVNVDGCRVGHNGEKLSGGGTLDIHHGWGRSLCGRTNSAKAEQSGRFPANLIHDGSDEVVRLFPVQPSGKNDGKMVSAARFFYCAKPGKRERDAGLEELPEQLHQSGMGGAMPIDDDGNERDRFTAKSRNVHPTVKALKLMTYLCRLITPPNGLILDPFTGSGSTGCAAMIEGFRFIGMEQSPEYAEIALKRIEHWAREASELIKEPPLPLFEVLENQSE